MTQERTPYVALTDQNFQEEVLQNSQPVLVDFWAPWCGPCQAMNATVADLASELDGKVTVGKVNVDEQPQTATQYNIRSIPTFLVFQNGNVVANITGAVPKRVLTEKLQHVLKAA